MGSLIDLNLHPDPPNPTAGCSTSAATLITPKIEPKLEPFDHPPPSNPPNPNPNLGLPTTQPISHPEPVPDETNVYSEFDRISEMFLTAFANKIDKNDDFMLTDPDAQAIVPVPEQTHEENQLANATYRRKDPPRSSELVRVSNLGTEDERYFREVMRKTRMIYDSLRVLVVAEDEKRRSFDFVKSPRSRGDLKAASVMKERGLWLNRDKRIVGAIPGVNVGDVFFFRMEKNGGDFAYDSNGLLVRGKPLIFECGPHCHCPATCQNRVSQKGLRNRFEVFRSQETGWGVRSLDLIQAGSFICEYTGVVLTREQAQLFTMNGDSLVYPNRFGERWAEWGDLSQIFTDYVRPTYPSVPPLDFGMDVSRMRNLACYMSHSSCPNVLVQLVLYDHSNIAFPHLMLFAMENIPPMRELSLDYGAADEWLGKLPICN
ncbi:putative [histone H3]-lysine(4) N-trimethyltransferase chromatin remodeling SET family [Helianthus annuus]|nr:putative [histone H3]-lysine(4) N-trimethyltransferase chromatin remodeling SET family [Helianthus annuus]